MCKYQRKSTTHQTTKLLQQLMKLQTIKAGTLSKNAIKTNLLNLLNIYLTVIKSTVKKCPVFSLTKLIVFCKYKKATECDTYNTLEKSWDRGKTKLKR